ncbi:Repressible high-affinity phosphate permease [Venturia nashicola]|uniref:Repressible high-affinity phosphate permease n=1 Tax=Venturia nashicola TaxID=86259 RepID=A0A4Z1NXI2_9PEZI|nr:Repressible high-affinity phosphate permease [Venturia nashicola]TLD23418.1 Repressible high-affinity phosphate permease [Venturia nashicola]
MSMNVFRVVGDLSHVASKVILLWSIHWNRSAEGVSLITQTLYIAVFSTRYLDLFWSPIFGAFIYFWNFCLKLFYISSSAYIVFLMMSVFARTREKEKAWKFGIYCFAGAAILAMPVTAMFMHGPQVHYTVDGKDKHHPLYEHSFAFFEILWTFSEILESVAVLPQLLLLRQTTVPTVIDSYYLACLGSYRGFYILNWIYRVFSKTDRHFDPISVIFGCIQTLLYVDFAWVYLTRQRVKLRGGGIVDSEDMSRGWLVQKLVGRHSDLDDEEASPALHTNDRGNDRSRGGAGHKWGVRGISVSADEGVHEGDEDARALTDPTAFEDDLSDDEGAPPTVFPERRESLGKKTVQEGADEWAEEADK